ncbi:MAG: hypothetical protein KDH19_09000, partial [Geminicoccaceae bacterium]|nr:hypothetical protein [Geminicoccaceae bacterium]
MIAGLGRALLYFLLLVIVMAGVAFGVLQTRFAKDRIAQFAEEALTNDDQSARIEGLGGFLPFDIRVERFALSDKEGVWLEVDDARFEVSPTRLVSRELLIDRITAARVAVHRQPDLPPAEEEEPAEPFALPGLPDLPENLPVGLRAETIGVERIELGEPVIGEAMQLAFHGSVTTSPARERVDLHLDVDRTDKETLAATIALGVDLPGETIGIDVKVDETGGLVARLANMPEAGPLHLSLDGDGPLSAWRARLDLDIGNLVKGNVDLDLAYSQTPSIDLVAEIVPAEDTVPPEIDDIVGERLHLALQAAHPAPQQVELKTLSLTSRALTVDGSGKASLDDNIVEGTITARMDDLDRLSGIAGTPLGGALRLTLDAVGTFVDPTLQVDVDGSSLSGADFLVQTAEGRFDVSFLAPLDAGFEGVDVKGGLTVEGMQQGGEPLRPEDALTLAVKAHVPLEGEARIEQLDIVGETVDLSTRAVLAMPSLAGTARIEGHVESLEELMQALGSMAPPELALHGSLELTADATIGDGAKEIEADIRLTGSQIRGLPEGADPLLGSSPSLATRVTFVQGEAVRVDGLKLDAAALSMDGGASLGLDSGQALDGEVNLAIPALAAFSRIAKQELAGRAGATVTLAGSLGQPKAEAKARVQDLQAAGQDFDEIRLDATASGPADKLAGRVVVEAEQFGRTLGVSSDYALTPKTLELAGLALEGPATDIRGGLTLDLATSLAGGTLKGGISDLSALEPWHKQALAGSLAVDVELDDRSGRQDVVARIEIPTASGDFGRISGLSADARINDALGKLAVDAGIELAGFSAPDLEVTAAKVDLEGDAGLLNLNATASGRQKGEPFDITTAARLDVAGAPQQIFLDSLSGRAAGQDIELRAPARLVLDKGVMQIDKLDLVVGEARIQGGASMNDGRLAGRFDLGPLPLSMLASFGAPELTGTAEGRIELDGSSAKPRIGVTLDLAQIRPPGRFYRNKPGFDANIATTIGNGTLSLDVELAGLADQPGTITLSMPLGLSLDPPAFDFANTARLDGTIRAKADIGKLSVLAPLDGQRIAGVADIDLAIGGRVNRPDIRGRIVLDNGFVQDEGSGFTLADTALELEVKNQRVEIAKLQATDGGKGRIALE